MRDGQKCRGGKCRTGKCGTRLQGWKMRDWKMRDQYAGVENAGQLSMESLFVNNCAEANVRLPKNYNSFSSFDTVVSNSCTICFVFINVFSV